MRQRLLLLLATVLCLTLAGCSGSLGSQSSSAPATSTTTETPVELSASEATERALEAETHYVSARLQNASCLHSWGIGEYTTEADARVINWTSRGVVIQVQRPYSWEKNTSIADLSSEARYIVTDNKTVRMSGSSITPC